MSKFACKEVTVWQKQFISKFGFVPCAGEGKVEGRLSTAKATFTLLPLTKVGSPLLFKFLQGKSISADPVKLSKLTRTIFIGIPKPSPKLVGCQGGSIPPKLI